MATIDEPSRESYGLGHADDELERLEVQARLIEPITRRWLVEAGIQPGMRVLDVGSGVGDVAFLVADLVGTTGEVIGTDRADAPLTVAAERAAARSLTNVQFVRGDPSAMAFDEPFDAVVGRYVLMYQPDPSAMVRQLVARLRPGAVVMFQEPYRDGVRSFPPVPSYDRAWQLVDDSFGATGADMIVGIKLHSVFTRAGLPAPMLRLESVIAGGGDCLDHIHSEVDPMRTMLPHIGRLGLASAAEIDIDTYADRVRDELIATDSVIVGRTEIGAWARVP